MTSTGVSPKKSSPLHEILHWSASRPEWQRDALRRIIEKGNLTDADIEELERISRNKVQNPAIKPISLVPQPLTTAHLPSASGASDSVSLLSLTDLKNVNRLPHGSALPFGPGKGLAVIYGGNGAGKSSYARVVKKVCRARGTSPNIAPNVFAQPANNSPASATILFQAGSANAQCAWANGTPADARLANVFVFDASSAEHYVGFDSEASFTPYGLDVLPKLSKACDVLMERLKKDIGDWNSKITAAGSAWKSDPITETGKLIQSLSKTTKVSEVSTLATFSTADLQRLATLRDALKADPLQKAKQTRASKARIEAFLQRVNAACNALSDIAAEIAETQLAHAIDSAAAAKAFAEGQFDTSYLAGTGSDLWRSLWEAAREYSTAESFPDEEFPPTSPDARCALCQQELDSAARDRFARFDAFCRDKSQEISAKAEHTLSQTINSYRIHAQLKPDLDKIEADLSILASDQIARIAEFVAKADERLQQFKQNLESRQWSALPPVPPTSEPVLRDAVKALEDRAVTEESANDPVSRKALESELKELNAREWLSGVMAEVQEQIERYKIVAELDACKKDFNTAAITTKSSELTETFVTAAYKQRFQEETKKLGLTTLNVVMESIQGKKGVTQFGLRLVNAAGGKVAEIASEGERRCMALAAFLAELSQASHQSALVFDDPVSSLDHWHRQKIAERLVAESATRQVIVFTHEAIFLNDLISLAENTTQTPYVLTLGWENGAPGSYIEGLPWDHKKPLECLDTLDKKQTLIASQWNPQPSAANVESMRNAYSLLRSVMERIVESELLDGVVQRFESQVVAGRVKYLAGVSVQECTETKRLLQKCHDLTNAHAPSSVAIPVPDDLKQDIGDARALISTIRARKKTIK